MNTMSNKNEIKIIGGGLAGIEAAWQAAKRNISVTLYEMRPQRMTPAHTGDRLAELVCSNSLRAAGLGNAVGLLKEEMRRYDSLMMAAADATAVPAGGALAVDRTLFSDYIEEKLFRHPCVKIVREEVLNLPDTLTVVAAGPLAAAALSKEISAVTGKGLYFHDAIAPIITEESVNTDICFWGSRYDKGDGDDYLNCPMSKEQYDNFYHALINAELALLHDFDGDTTDGVEKTFEGCLPVEVLAKRGEHTLRYGPMKPVGIRLPDGSEAYAIVQLRRENAEGTMLNLVGFQTRLKRGEQERVFRLIPGLENCEIIRYGAMHRNTYIESPRLLYPDLRLKTHEHLLFAGQITGVEGYVESGACGLAAGINASLIARGEQPLIFPRQTAIGSLLNYITVPTADFQPMNINFSLMPTLPERIRNKKEKNLRIAALALSATEEFMASHGLR